MATGAGGWVHDSETGQMRVYGMEVAGVEVDNDLTGEAVCAWHPVLVRQVPAEAPSVTSVEWGTDTVSLAAADRLGLTVRRDDLSATIAAPRPLPDLEVVHPLLVFVGAVVARWSGRSAFHGAAVVLDGRAWVLLAHPGGGKSTLASVLSRQGHPVLADDLSVVDGRTVLAGPRSCDLRRETAAHLGRHEPADPISQLGRRRWREQLGAAPHEVPLGGFVSLSWSESVSCTRAGVGRKLDILRDHEALGRGPTHAESFLDLLDVPFLLLARPRAWTSLDETVRLLVAVTAS